jgi:acyl-CoA thioesterase-1
MDYQVVNAGVSGETSSGGVGRIEWILNQPVDVFILELGANDGLRGIPVETTAKNLQTIMDSVKSKNPSVKIILAGMQVPPNMGAKYANAFKAIFPTLAEKNKVALIPFLLEGVGGEPALNQADGIHPNEEGHRKVAEVVWQTVGGIL